MRKVQEFWSQALALAIFAALCWLFYLTLHHAWLALVGVSPQLAVALIAGTSTILVGTLTVTLGRYYERKRDIESHFRTEKIKIYDEFLQELFKVFHSETQMVAGPGDDLIKFLREWQRKLVLWGGPYVLRSYFRWIGHLKQGKADAKAILLMDEFFRALRSDIGQSSARLEKGAFVHLILRNGDFFLEQARQNPNITLAEFGQWEEKRFGPDSGSPTKVK